MFIYSNVCLLCSNPTEKNFTFVSVPLALNITWPVNARIAGKR